MGNRLRETGCARDGGSRSILAVRASAVCALLDRNTIRSDANTLKMKTSTGRPTKDQVARFAAFQRIGCICCRLQGYANTDIEVHHLISGNRRMGHDHTIPLCPWHHRAVPTFNHAIYSNHKQCRDSLGPSLAEGSKPFRAHFGSDSHLLSIVNKMLETP